MTPIFPVLELFDRLAIAEIKWTRTQNNKFELDWYTNQSKQYNVELIKEPYEELKNIHNKIWELESQLKSGQEDELGLEEIGRRAILIRDWNNKRVAIKNRMAALLECNVREIKTDHLSE